MLYFKGLAIVRAVLLMFSTGMQTVLTSIINVLKLVNAICRAEM